MTKIEAWGAVASGAAFLVFLALLMVTPGYWFDLRSLAVEDAKYGRPIPIEYHREFYRDFDGAWRVMIWKLDRGEWTSYCEASGSWGYRKATPDPEKDLAWLVDGKPRCSLLPVGVYTAEVKIAANPGSILERSQSIMSNPFEVTQ